MLLKAEIEMRKIPGICLPNYYSVELLANAQISQELINLVEALLANKNLKTLENSLLQKFCIKNSLDTAPKALLIETHPLFLKAHTILINNCGYVVGHCFINGRSYFKIPK